MSEIEKILADVPKEGDTDPFKDLVETPPESPTGKEEEKVLEEKPVPFHEHPRWIERENELKALREREELTLREIEELKAFKEEAVHKLQPQNTTIPDWFRELYGDNAVAWSKYQEHDQTQRQQIKQEILEEQWRAQQQAQQESTYWTNWVDKEISRLEGEGKAFDRHKLIKTMLEYRPTDENNNFDFKKGYEIYAALEGKTDPGHSQARKQFADTTTKTTPGEKKPQDYQTPATMRNKSWNNL